MIDAHQLADLFRRTGSAHHAAFAATNGEDPEWPAWYASYLAEPLSKSLNHHFEPAALERDLIAVDAAHRSAPDRPDWPSYYARWFLERYARSHDSGSR